MNPTMGLPISPASIRLSTIPPRLFDLLTERQRSRLFAWPRARTLPTAILLLTEETTDGYAGSCEGVG